MTLNTSGNTTQYSPATPSPNLLIGIATVPMQPWEKPYDAATALKHGTIFPCLDLPFYATGGDK